MNTNNRTELPVLDKKTLDFVINELHLWRNDTLFTSPQGFPFAGWIDTGLFIEAMEILKEKAV
jgi:hypothetical protein